MRILVCGTNYGATYIRALSIYKDKVNAVAILSTGSDRSRAYAKKLKLNHYIGVNEIPDNTVDIACVAVAGEAGHELVLALLARGIHVLCEHPVDGEKMRKALALAEMNRCTFQVNAHFSDLQAPQAFFNALVVANQQGRCLHYDLSLNLRTLYSGLDLLGRANGSLTGFTVSEVGNDHGSALFINLRLLGPDVSVSLLCQNFASALDDGSATLLNHRVSATFTHGNLLLAESNGPVLWFPSSVSMTPESWRNCLPVDMSTVNQYQLQQKRDSANLNTIHKMIATIQGDPIPTQQQPEYLLALATLWEQTLVILQAQATP